MDRLQRVTIIIPARAGSSRFPGKPLAVLRGAKGPGKPLIQWVWEAAQKVEGVSRILVATDDREIFGTAEKLGAEVVMTSSSCRNGSERCAEAMQRAGIDDGIVINLQGDAPLTPPAALDALIEAMANDRSVEVASPMLRCPPETIIRLVGNERRGQPGGTTVVTDHRSDALYFSRRVLPYFSGDAEDVPVFMHLGVYAYRCDALTRYAATPPCASEQLESLEQLRFLHAGIAIRMVEIAEPPGGLWEVNYPSDIALVEAGLHARDAE